MKISRRSVGDAKRRALIVEADIGTREVCRGVLEALGFTVNAVDSGVAAVAAARAAKPDVVLFDLQLHDVGGTELLNWLRDNPMLRDVPMIAISVLSQDNGTTTLVNELAGVVKKPVSRAILKSTIRHALGLSAGA